MGIYNILVCSNYFLELKKAIELEKFDDVNAMQYKCICGTEDQISGIESELKFVKEKKEDCLLLCHKKCSVTYLATKYAFDVKSANSCLSHLVPFENINAINKNKGLIISTNWLQNWKEKLKQLGYDMVQARKYYSENYSKIYYFDAKVEPKAGELLKELSAFINIPYAVLPLSLDRFRMNIRCAVYEWRMKNRDAEYENNMAKVLSQSNDYAAIIDIISKLALYTNKREAFDKLKELFSSILGAQKFRFYNEDSIDEETPTGIKRLFSDPKSINLVDKENIAFYIKIVNHNIVYGAIQISDFISTKNITKYLNIATEITKIYGMVLFNIEQYEKLAKSERDLYYLSYHDALTDLYNRAYIKTIISTKIDTNDLAIFSIDIDGINYINGKYSRIEGDKVIITTADILKKCFRETDIVARAGGDEFIVVIPKCDEKTLEMLNGRINETIIAQNESIENEHLKISLSIGYSLSKEKDEPFDSILHKADEFMYGIKRVKQMK